MHHMFIMLPSTNKNLGCFLFIAIVHKAKVNMDEQISLEEAMGPFGYMPRHGRTRPYAVF